MNIAHSTTARPGSLASRFTDEESVALLTRMVEIPSLSGQERTLAVFMVEWLTCHGFRAEHDAVGNVIGTIGDERPDRLIVLLGHMDTVPGDIPARAEGDLLYGRGTVDAKGPLATFLTASARARLPDGVAIAVIGAVEEETPTSRGARAIIDRFRPDACVIGEPSAWHGITIGYKGRLVVEYTVDQPSAHSAGPHGSAPDAALAWWARVLAHLETWNVDRSGSFERIQASIRGYESSADGLTDRATLRGWFRLPPGTDPAELEHELRLLLHAGSLTACGAERAVVAERDNAVVRHLGHAIRRREQRPVIRVKTGTSDMNVVGPRWGCPIAAYGPGDSALDHTPNEHISVSEFLRAVNVLTEALESLAVELVTPPSSPPGPDHREASRPAAASNTTKNSDSQSTEPE